MSACQILLYHTTAWLAALFVTVAIAYFTDDAYDLQDFLRSCNPRQQLSGTFESYLIKPIQRILKYPLLLRQLMELTEAYTDEHRHLAGDNSFTELTRCRLQ